MTGLTVTCICGKSEFFEGDLLDSIGAFEDSGRWFVDSKGFFRCGEPQCAGPPKQHREQLPLFR